MGFGTRDLAAALNSVPNLRKLIFKPSEQYSLLLEGQQRDAHGIKGIKHTVGLNQIEEFDNLGSELATVLSCVWQNIALKFQFAVETIELQHEKNCRSAQFFLNLGDVSSLPITLQVVTLIEF